MTDQMREALEKIANLDYITPGCEADALRSATSIAREALASAQPEGPELTDAELDEIWTKHAMSATFDCVHLLREAIAAHEAKRNGGAS